MAMGRVNFGNEVARFIRRSTAVSVRRGHYCIESNHYNRAPRFCWMLDELVCAGNFVQRDPFGDGQPAPSFLKRLIDSSRGLNFGVSRYVVAAHKEDSYVTKNELPERDFRRGSIRGVGCDGTALRQYFNVELDVRGESDFNNVIDAVGSHFANASQQSWIGEEDSVCPGARSDFGVGLRAASGDNARSRSMCELNCAGANRARSALHRNGASFDWAGYVNSAMSGHARNAQAGALFNCYALGHWHNLPKRDHGVFSGGAERTVALGSITPDTPADPFRWYSQTDGIDGPRTVAVGNNTRIRHTQSKRIFALLHIAWVHAGSSDANPNFASEGLWFVHVADDQNVSRRALPFVPCRSHVALHSPE